MASGPGKNLGGRRETETGCLDQRIDREESKQDRDAAGEGSERLWGGIWPMGGKLRPRGMGRPNRGQGMETEARWIIDQILRTDKPGG